MMENQVEIYRMEYVIIYNMEHTEAEKAAHKQLIANAPAMLELLRESQAGLAKILDNCELPLQLNGATCALFSKLSTLLNNLTTNKGK